MINTRINTLQKKLRDLQVDAMLIERDINRYYLTGFTGSFGYLIITQEDAILFTNKLEIDQAKNEVKELKIIETAMDLSNILSFIRNANINAISIEDSMSLATFNHFKSSLDRVKVIITNGVIEEMRIVKDDFEINMIREANEITDIAFSHILKFIKPGTKEIDIAIELETFLKRYYHVNPSFEIIVASGIRGAMPHGHASNKIIEDGEMVTIDFGLVHKGYRSDMTRTIAVGKPDPKLKYIYEIVLLAQQSSISQLRHGIPASQIDGISRKIIEESGFIEYTHSICGHGIGLELHESPYLTKNNPNLLTKGMVLTVEPGINIPGLGGVRIEDTVLIHDSRFEILSKSSKELITLPLC